MFSDYLMNFLFVISTFRKLGCLRDAMTKNIIHRFGFKTEGLSGERTRKRMKKRVKVRTQMLVMKIQTLMLKRFQTVPKKSN